MKLFLFAAIAAVVFVKCVNDCSFHGECNAKNQCECHRNFFGPDCSQRLCPAGRAFIDSAVGDLNGDNSVGVDLVYVEGRAAKPISEVFSYQYGSARDSYDVTAAWNEAHFYQECSSKGICDTSTGECDCFPGYEGSGCARKSCENDCSGHGACKNYAGTTYNMWDKDSTLYCDCDAGYTGPGCEQRHCPAGVDPVQASNMDVSRMYRIAFRTLSQGDGDFDGTTFYKAPYGAVKWTITLTDEFGDEWTTPLLTTNYDVIVDSSNVPQHSMPIINAASMDTNGVDIDSDWDVTVPLNYNSFGDGSYHVAEEVVNALESLPDSASGQVTVHELYTSPALVDTTSTLLSEQYPAPFTGQANADYHLEFPMTCGPTDIYLTGEQASADGAALQLSADSTDYHIAGCGVGIVDSQLGTDACTARQGNQDVNDFLENTGDFDAGTISNGISDQALNVISGLSATANIAASTSYTIAAKDDTAATPGIFPLYDSSTLYYQWPHYSNSDDNTARFPLFEDLEASCSGLTGYYASGSTYYEDVLGFDTDGDTTITSMAGLSLFLRFQESTIETVPRVDYTFNNQAANAFLGSQPFTTADGTLGETVEGISNGSGDYESHSLVRVNDVTGARSWDVAYHGVRSYFLDDGTDTSTGVTNHICSKRGLCDYSTGLCDCFSGFTGANCAEQNALAY
jgi:hypothetical protein